VPESASRFLDREDAVSSLQQFSTGKGVDVLLVIYVFYSDAERKQYHRQIEIYCLDSKLLNKVSRYLVGQDVLALKEVSQNEPNIRLFDQENTSVSRKKVLALISAALSQEDIPSFKSFVEDLASVQTAKELAESGDGTVHVVLGSPACDKIAHRISQSKLGTVHVVLGSPACDVDSMASSVARAYYSQVTGRAPSTGVRAGLLALVW
jgi:hypothetical protein